jgi:hypothetical protein
MRRRLRVARDERRTPRAALDERRQRGGEIADVDARDEARAVRERAPRHGSARETAA